MRESIFKTVFFGKPKDVSLFSWMRFLFLEVYLGEQLLEMFGNTASYNVDAPFNGKTNGWERELIDYIPATFFNRVLSESIVDLLRVKFSSHYQLIELVPGSESEELYKLNNQRLHFLTELKLAYNTIWITLNIAIDILVFAATNDVTATLLTGAFIEFLRRFKW